MAVPSRFLLPTLDIQAASNVRPMPDIVPRQSAAFYKEILKISHSSL
jgi:hypothetical protein